MCQEEKLNIACHMPHSLHEVHQRVSLMLEGKAKSRMSKRKKEAELCHRDNPIVLEVIKENVTTA